MELKPPVKKALKAFVTGYIVISLFYSAYHLFSVYRGSPATPTPTASAKAVINISASLKNGTWGPQRVKWTNPEGVTDDMPEDFMLTKVFSDAMGPCKVIPYYFRATEEAEAEDITLATLVTHNRLDVLSRLATRYQGPISAAIHINDDEQRDIVLNDLHAMYEGNPHVQRHVDVHLIVDRFDRQFNMWRNVAKFFARTEYLMMLDVDFHLCTDFRKSIRSNSLIMEKLRTGTAALVVPAFEFIEQKDGLDWKTFPTDKKQLMDLVRAEKIDMFHRSWQRGHGSTDYNKWYESDGEYVVTEYNYSYEPYIIYKKEGSPWCDERFIGYGANKAACLYEIYLSGIDYWILPNDFLIHQTHFYLEDTRKKERKYNKKLYDNFREEVCLRYSRMMIANNLWSTPRADNVKAECSKIKGFKSAVGNLN
ncbi:hypothetical protein INT43_001613 [Umbelopsis isabellina]|uniref:Glycosyltransferase family 49 protein n=1 Tax=Mortierella isabellina TaxID=91625 RepID=A0A8H7PR38_MORIS|nr:hypothetical protein INT43_001613 [Umbelopsis isabellina]